MLRSALLTGLETLLLNPLRSILSALGIVMGVAALVAVLSLGDGMQDYAREQIERTTDLQTISVSPQLFEMVDGKRFPRSEVTRFLREHADTVKTVVGDSASVILLISGQSLVSTKLDTTTRATIVDGSLETIGNEMREYVIIGRMFSRDEVLAATAVTLISRSLALRVFPGLADSLIIGESLLFYGNHRQVIGIIEPSNSNAGGGDGGARDFALMPVTVAEEAMAPALVGRASSIIVKVRKVEEVAAVKRRIESWLRSSYGESWNSVISLSTNEMRVAQVAQGMMLFKILMGALTGVSLLVGGVGIMNVLLASVAERTREIGIRRATGALRRDLLLQFLAESVVITMAGSAIGIVLGAGGAYAATALMRRVTEAQVYAGFSFSTFAVAVLASVSVGLGFGLYPAMRASRLSPIDAIRHE